MAKTLWLMSSRCMILYVCFKKYNMDARKVFQNRLRFSFLTFCPTSHPPALCSDFWRHCRSEVNGLLIWVLTLPQLWMYSDRCECSERINQNAIWYSAVYNWNKTFWKKMPILGGGHINRLSIWILEVVYVYVCMWERMSKLLTVQKYQCHIGLVYRCRQD